MSGRVEFGLDTFGDRTVDAQGTLLPYPQVIRNVVDQAVLADRSGVDFIGIGEHHRADYAISAPDVVLAGIATRTERIRLGSAVTVLSSDDPIRVFERFSTIDALSGGRAEVILGRGSFTESFPLFGFDLGQYEELFAEKLDLFAELLAEKPVTWSGELRPPLVDQDVYPKTAGGLKAWIAVGGTPQSVVRAANYRIPLMLAVIGGPADRFTPFVQIYRRANEQLGQPQLPIGLHSPGHIADTDQEARDQLREPWITNRNKIGSERGWPPARSGDFEREIEQGALYVGSPETVSAKIAATVRTLDVDRFDLKYSDGPLPHEYSMRAIELYGTQVIPRVRELLSE
ncbi:LLM class flavin-dependent oxidoreductase [Allobranchiibius sp. GilTou73]|uniref:LLM class flavin-dependent oxidoreductase n=1 Tax=Allobranchiibius sp. GilTou73 TaxID=2904523 RepID=UPI001F1D7FE7|nr:LLM class flavin-dependent oxidoreductase [Allobranchiibius sp. GilTou73]UIJ35505.1 LLM class flavin-dependent oxidoreductase [Allobranchiibius sp. GilTou73]